MSGKSSRGSVGRGTEIAPTPDIASLIRLVRDVRVILDTDLAQIYGVETRALNQALKPQSRPLPG